MYTSTPSGREGGRNVSVDGRAISRLFSGECQMKNWNDIFRIMDVATVDADFFF